MTCWLLNYGVSAIHHNNRQDAREGGESPPLPRNCERQLLWNPVIGTSSACENSARILYAVCERTRYNHLSRAAAFRLWEGG